MAFLPAYMRKERHHIIYMIFKVFSLKKICPLPLTVLPLRRVKTFFHGIRMVLDFNTLKDGRRDDDHPSF